MSKKRDLICHYCKEYFDRDILVQVTKSKRACPKCNETMVRESAEYKELIEYLCLGLGLKAPTGYMLKTIAKKKELGYGYKDMQWTVYYMACVRKLKLDEGCINLVPTFYKDMVEHMRLVEKANKTEVNFVKSVEVVKRKEYEPPKVKNTRLVNIEEIF